MHMSPLNKTEFNRIESNFLPVTEEVDNQLNVLVYSHAYPESSVPPAELYLGISFSAVQSIFQETHHPYCFKHDQSFRPGGEILRFEFCEFIIVKIREDP